MDLLAVMIRDCKHERGMTYTSRFLASILFGLTGIYTDDTRFVNEEEWISEGMLCYFIDS